VLSFNGLAVTVTVNTRFRVIREELPQLHVEIGPDYVKKLVEPVVLASVREVIGRYRPEELYTTHSTTVQDEVDRVSQAAIAGHHIELMIVVVENMKLPEQVNSAIEEKLQIQQQAQAYEFRLAREAQEAERKRLEAEGQDQYNALLSRSLNPRLLQFLSIDAMRAMATSPNSKVVVVPAGQVPSIPLMLDTNLAPAKEEPAVPPKTVP
ncbi:MAG TPA: prohibitin family protein, partial [Myxococcota bacterium]|nr:prohibitin family protein [Myxococcota bacterium]